MKVLALASYPVQAAATRYRLEQFVQPLAEQGISLSIRPFLDSDLFEILYQRRAFPRIAIGLIKSAFLRLNDLITASEADVVLLQREAMMFGPPLIEWFAARVLKRPLVLDLDDATYVSYTSPTYGSLGKYLKWFSKTDDLIRWSSIVTCGNSTIAEYVARKGGVARVIPTVVDTDLFRPAPGKNDPLVLGWIGTHSTFPYLKEILPVMQYLAKTYRFRLKVVGAGKQEVKVPGVEVENLEWTLPREVQDFQSFDIGLYPISPHLYAEGWAAGKSGFKSIQYMAVGIPYVVSPVGAAAELGESGMTHFPARTNDEWRDALALLLSDPEKRKQMGAAGRRYVIKNYSLPAQADKLVQALREAAKKRKTL
ncbi:MAG: glycosyltransferase family 4 protein [Pyrinomonadaceae bacterium]